MTFRADRTAPGREVGVLDRPAVFVEDLLGYRLEGPEQGQELPAGRLGEAVEEAVPEAKPRTWGRFGIGGSSCTSLKRGPPVARA